MKKWLLFLLLSTCVSAQGDVFYQVFQRSFFDSDGDKQGDLNGIGNKLDYLQELGVTTILLTPLYASDFYHNYFAYDFESLDPEYGKMNDYLQLVREVHKRKMKIYQDVEMQYIAGKHPWFTSSFGHPDSPFSDYLVYGDNEKLKPFFFFNFPEFTLYDGRKEKIIVVNMKSQSVKDYTFKVLNHWVDPNSDGKFDDGVDGFRLDHMMDDLDNAGRLKDLFRDFWTPLLSKLRTANPKLKIVAEQANWGSFGHDYFTRGNVDYVFGFRLKFAIDKLDKQQILMAADSTFCHNPPGKNQLIFLENHDTGRFASHLGMTWEKSKAAIALQLLMGGMPSVYYGQEIGMKGKQQSFGATDGNDIPVREAFEWYADGNGPGMARWYENSGPWWDERHEKANDGISLEEQRSDPASIWHFYQKLLELRQKNKALREGTYENAENDSPQVLSFYRSSGKEKVLVLVNLSGEPQTARILGKALDTGKNLLEKGSFYKNSNQFPMPPYGLRVLKVSN